MNGNELSRLINGAAIEVHRRMGPGLLESVYEECMAYEFAVRSISFEGQKSVPLTYKGQKLDASCVLIS